MGHVAWLPMFRLLSWYHAMESSHCNSFGDRATVDEIYGCPIFKWVAVTCWHDDVIQWKHFPHYWPFMRGIHPPVISEFPSQRPVTQSFDVFFDQHLNKRLGKQSRRRWFEKQSCSIWRHCNGKTWHHASNGPPCNIPYCQDIEYHWCKNSMQRHAINSAHYHLCK